MHIGIQPPSEMFDGAVIASSQSVGVQGVHDNKPVAMTAEYADSGFPPVSIASRAAGLSRDVTENGIAALALVGGKEHEATLHGRDLQNSGMGAGRETAHVDAPGTGIATHRTDPSRSV